MTTITNAVNKVNQGIRQASDTPLVWLVSLCLIVWILSAAAWASTTGPENAKSELAETVFFCKFGPESDRNFDRWPDRWIRQEGPGFPRYNKIRLVYGDTSKEKPPQLADQPEAGSANEFLEVLLKGQGAGILSPLLPCNSQAEYLLEAKVWGHNLAHNRIWMSLTFYDEKLQVLESHSSSPVLAGPQWQTIVLGPVACPLSETKWLQIGLHVTSSTKGESDIGAQARFAWVKLKLLPQTRLILSNHNGIYTTGNPIEATYSFAVTSVGPQKIAYRVETPSGATVDEGTLLNRNTENQGTPKNIPRLAPALATAHQTMTFHLRIPRLEPGFYILRIIPDKTAELEREAAFAVVDNLSPDPNPTFGITLPSTFTATGCEQLPELLRVSATGLLRSPVSLLTSPEASSLRDLASNWGFSRSGFQHILLIDHLPNTTSQTSDVVASLARNDDAALQAVLKELTALKQYAKIWQLCDDADARFTEVANLPQSLALIKRTLFTTADNGKLIIPWPTGKPLPQETTSAWDAVVFSRRMGGLQYISTQTAEAVAGQHTQEVWLVLDPTDTETSAATLVKHCVLAKVSGADRIILGPSAIAKNKLFDASGRIGPWFLPWRSICTHIRGSFAGSMVMPNGSCNFAFRNPNSLVLVVWNDKAPTTERIYLGDKPLIYDIYGRQLTGHKYQIQVGTEPIFITNVNPDSFRWRRACELSVRNLPSTPGERQKLHFSFSNTLGQRAVGTLLIEAPQGWVIEPKSVPFVLQPGEKQQVELSVILPFDVSFGQHSLKFNFSLQKPVALRFAAFRTVDIKPEGFSISVETAFVSDNMLEIRETITNEQLQPSSFRCHLYVPGQQKQTRLVSNLAGKKTTSVVFRIENAENLIDKYIWLQTQKIGSKQIYNRKILIRRE